MASVLGTPTSVAPGGNYTAESGSNRVVVLVSCVKGATTTDDPVCSTITYNSIARAPSIQGQSSTGDNITCVAISVFLESEINAGAVAVNHSYPQNIGSERIYCLTIDGIAQSGTVRTSGYDSGGGAGAVTLSGLTAGDVCIGGGAGRNATTYTANSTGFTIHFNETQGSMQAILGSIVVSGTSATFDPDNGQERATVGIALAAGGASGNSQGATRRLLLGVG